MSLIGTCPAHEPPPLVAVERKESADSVSMIEGRILARESGGGLLVEERSGRIHRLPSAEVVSVTEADVPFVPLSRDEMAAELLQQSGAGFSIHQTDHHVLCSDASEVYTEYCRRLLQNIVTEYSEFFAKTELAGEAIPSQLPVIIFSTPERLLAFARQQHPDTDFTDVPGYYSVRDNQMLIAALPGDGQFRSTAELTRAMKRHLRHVETIVHEAVHQLAFNTGLQVRYADNPLWLSEGLAVYFEHASGRSSTLWTGPGGVSRIHLPGFQSAVSEDRLRLPLTELLASDAAFLSGNQLAEAYAEGWALVFFLIRTDRRAFDRYLKLLEERRPLVTTGAQVRIRELEAATGQSVGMLEEALIRYMRRIRGPR